MKYVKIIIYNVIILISIFSVLEVTTRVMYPEYSNAYFSDHITRGNQIYKHTEWGHRVSKVSINHVYKRKDHESRVLFVGDSVTLGYGVPFDEAFHSVANKQLSVPGCNLNIDGIGRYYSNLEKIMHSDFREFIFYGYDPDLVIYQFNVNDLDPLGPPKKNKNDRLSLREKFEKIRLSYLNRSAFLKAMQSTSIRMYQQAKHIKLADSLRYSELSDPKLYKQQWDLFESSLANTKNTLSNLDINFAILLVPESIRVSQSNIDNDFRIDASGIEIWPGEKVREISSRHGIPVIDAVDELQTFRKENPETRLYFPNDMNHPNPIAHKLIADAITNELPAILGECKISDQLK